MNYHEIIQISNIDFSLNYTGYIWLSDKQKPEVFESQKVESNLFGELPFVVEGQLYHPESQTSLAVKYVDGKYLITQYKLKAIPNEQLTRDLSFLAKRMQRRDGTKIEKLLMVQFWELAEGTALTEGMPELQPAWMAFTGFVQPKS